jgi:carboxymethylenebutenolidase
MQRRIFALVALTLTSACTVQPWKPSKGGALDEHMSHMSASDLRLPMVMNSGGGAESQGTPGLPASNGTAAARIKASPRHAEWVKVAWTPGSKDSLMAWIVYPTTNKKAPVVVVVHEIFGLSTWVRGVADQLAEDGFIAIAPDLVSKVRGGPSSDELSSDSARKIIGRVTNAEKDMGVQAVANYAMSQPSALKKYGVVGYCWGGSTAFNHAVYNGKGLGAAVAFYGTPYMIRSAADSTKMIVASDSLNKIKVPVMLLNGSNDARIAAAMPDIEQAMKALGKTYEGTNYQGAVHGFLRAQNDAAGATGDANYAATKDAWPKTVAFFKKHLNAK